MPVVIRVILALLALAIGGASAAAAALFGLYLYYAPTLPAVDSLREVRLQTPLRIYTDDGTLLGEFAEQRREPVPIEDMPERLLQAFVAAEDERFHRHHGVDPVGLLRAGINLFSTGERTQGGSTITMQLARNFFLTRERTYERKIREIFLAVQIERELSKEQILELYLNKIYLGQRAYGVAAAARVYFDRPLEELELDQIAILAGLPKAPSTTNPVTSPERATIRRNYVLRRMLDLELITPEEHAAAHARPVLSQRHVTAVEVDAHWVAETARQVVVNLWGDEAYTRGLKVYTTIDPEAQEAANRALREGLVAYDRRHGYRGPEMRLDETVTADAGARMETLRGLGVSGRRLVPAIVLQADGQGLEVDALGRGTIRLGRDALSWAIRQQGRVSDRFRRGDVIRIERTGDDGWRLSQRPEVSGALVAQAPQDGAILALAGGFDFFENRFDRALQAERQPGSAFKPIIYALALQQGMPPTSTLVDAPLVLSDPALGAEWRPENYSRSFRGPTPMREALASSRNLASIRLLNSLGVNGVHDDLVRFGLDLEQHPRNLSMALGTGTLTPVELNNAYALFANGGKLTTPWLIGRIEDGDGSLLYQAATPRTCPEPCAQPAGQNLELATSHGALRFAEPVPMLDPGVAWQMSEMLKGVIRSGTGRRAQELGRADLGGKTGTTNSYRDAWFAGFNADIVGTAWIGFDDNRELGSGESGGRAALPIWMGFMEQALAGRPEAPVSRPDDLVEVVLLPETGQRARDDDPRGQREWLLPAQIPEHGTWAPDPAEPATEDGTAPTIGAQPEFIF
ncbi:Multimodular transpeptidase-transglycosylase [Thioalkalivibrio nitratireducens DSM 14787]|uniref:Penicillin-binding protein 1A n=1 Tax=Thioalkalivibrio nitratireducens (strain DSM 14787 / UNIQEM 213 / ALEN2) TaxID=1255043 RepID=L0DZT1_THIND|nr:penicillin-binding protein 1A [Thioalkalivibrio nitratireducens]AGA35109.1 Multimodular transpeptidase-transglycosylase [Thioalkalivibrio nitratireducens DSM 14787]